MENYFAEAILRDRENNCFYLPLFFNSESEKNAKDFFEKLIMALRASKFVVESKREPKKRPLNSYIYSEILSRPILEQKRGVFCKIKLKESLVSKIKEAKPFVFTDNILIKCVDLGDKEQLDLYRIYENILPVYKIQTDATALFNEIIAINMYSEIKPEM